MSPCQLFFCSFLEAFRSERDFSTPRSKSMMSAKRNAAHGRGRRFGLTLEFRILNIGTQRSSCPDGDTLISDLTMSVCYLFFAIFLYSIGNIPVFFLNNSAKRLEVV